MPTHTPTPPPPNPQRAPPLIWALKTVTMCSLNLQLFDILPARESSNFDSLSSPQSSLTVREIPLEVLYTSRDRLSRIPQLLEPHRHQVEYLHTVPDKAITVPVCKLPRGQKLLGQANKTTSKSGHKRRSETFCRGRNLDHMAWLVNYKSNFCTWRKVIAILQCKFTAFGGNKSTSLLTLHIGASLSYIAIEARDSLIFSRIV